LIFFFLGSHASVRLSLCAERNFISGQKNKNLKESVVKKEESSQRLQHLPGSIMPETPALRHKTTFKFATLASGGMISSFTTFNCEACSQRTVSTNAKIRSYTEKSCLEKNMRLYNTSDYAHINYVLVHGTLMLSWTACCGRDAFLRILLFPNWQSLQNL
jgi:hypothetical protein